MVEGLAVTVFGVYKGLTVTETDTLKLGQAALFQDIIICPFPVL